MRTADPRTVMRVVLAALYLVAGILHLARPAGFVAITPGWVPWPREIVFVTGVAEIAGAIGLMIPRLRMAAGWALAAYAVAVFPANINHAINHIAIGGVQPGWWYHAPRLLLQPVIVWWALWAAGIIDWPARSSRRRG